MLSSNIDALTYGDRRINSLLTGDVRPGSLVLLHGGSGTGKSVLCQQLAYNAMCRGTVSVAYFTGYNKPDDLLDHMEYFSFHAHYHFVADRLRVYPLKSINRSVDTEDAVRFLLRFLSDLPSSFSLAIVDSINPLLIDMDAVAQVSLMSDLKRLCRSELRSLIMVTEPYVFSSGVLARLQSLCDYYLTTDNVPPSPGLEAMDSGAMKSLELLKAGGVEATGGNEYRFEVRPGAGINILPYITVRV